MKKPSNKSNQDKVNRKKPKSKNNKDIDRYNVEQYTGNRHTATMDRNLPLKLALNRISDYNKDPKHRGLRYELKLL